MAFYKKPLSKESDTAQLGGYGWRAVIGALLIAAGAVLFADQYLQTGWLRLLIMPGIGLFLFVWGLRLRHAGLIAAGGIVGGAGAGIYAALRVPMPFADQASRLLGLFGLGFLLVTLGTAVARLPVSWWALIPVGVLGALAFTWAQVPFNWLRLLSFGTAGVGVSLLTWGLARRLYGLVIAGSLLVAIGAGLWVGWLTPGDANALVRVGVMLVWFSFGWALITVFSRLLYAHAAWWPLIPGGILAMVGFGLYIGGDPDSALGFISNTGSIVLMILGLYLLLMRKGIHHE